MGRREIGWMAVLGGLAFACGSAGMDAIGTMLADAGPADARAQPAEELSAECVPHAVTRSWGDGYTVEIAREWYADVLLEADDVGAIRAHVCHPVYEAPPCPGRATCDGEPLPPLRCGSAPREYEEGIVRVL